MHASSDAILILLTGNDLLGIEESIQQYISSLPIGLEMMNLERFHATKHSIDTILSAAATLPMMSPIRLILIDDGDKFQEHDLEKLANALTKLPSTTRMVIKAPSLDARKNSTKQLKKLCSIREHHLPSPQQFHTYIQKRAQKHSLSLTTEVAELLQESVGYDSLLIERSLEKLALALGDNQEITPDAIFEYIADIAMEDTFSFATCVMLFKHDDALQILYKMQRLRKGEPIALLGMLAWQLRIVYRASVFYHLHNMPEREIGQKLKLFGPRLPPVMKAVKMKPWQFHEKRLLSLLSLDHLFKTSSTPAWISLTQWVLTWGTQIGQNPHVLKR